MSKIDVIILCGGRGIRLRPLTNNTPKPLVKIKNKEILSYIIDHVDNFSINKIYLATGYQSNKIKKYVLDKNLSNKITIVNSGINSDIIVRIQKCLKYIKNDFLVLYGDTLSDVNIKNLINVSKKNEYLATMTLWNMPIDFGVVKYNKKNIAINFNEKPKSDLWINIGYFYFSSKIKNIINRNKNWEKFIKFLVNKRYLGIFPHKSLHITVNTLHELKISEEKINNFKIKFNK
jgi:glucose-1-phosphate cytidylyltransferase